MLLAAGPHGGGAAHRQRLLHCPAGEHIDHPNGPVADRVGQSERQLPCRPPPVDGDVSRNGRDDRRVGCGRLDIDDTLVRGRWSQPARW